MSEEGKREIIETEPTEQSEPSDKMKARDWISIGLSFAALTISFGSAYWNILRQVDQLSVAVTGENPTASIDPTTRKLRVSEDNTLTFLNSGNRPVAITGMWLTLDNFPKKYKDEPEDKICYHIGWGAVSISIGEPFVVQPGAVEIRKFSLKDAVADRPRNGGFAAPNAKDDREELIFCAAFNFVLPDYQWTSLVQVGNWVAQVPDPNVTQLYAMKARVEPVYVLLSSWRTILDPYIKELRNRVGIRQPSTADN